MKNGSIIKDCNTTGSGGGIYSSYASASIDNSVIQNCVATSNYGAACFLNYTTSTSFSVTNSTIKDCSANGYGGLGITSTSANVVTFTLSNTTIDNCKATSGSYGGLYATYTTTTMSNTTIQNCTATANYGAAYFGYSSLTMNNGSNINDCSANSYGGLGMVGSSSIVGTLTMTDVTIDNCNAISGNYGGIYSTYTDVTMDNTIIGNCSGNSGGGVYALNMNSFVMKNNSKIQNCSAINGTAGALYIGGVSSTSMLDATISDSTIYNCTATTYGGGIYLYRYSDLTVTNSSIDTCGVNGVSGVYGGGLYSQGYNTTYPNTVEIKNSTINDCYLKSNVTTNGIAYGGGISATITSITLDNTTVQDCYSSATGGTGYAYAYGGGIYSTYGLTLSNNSKIVGCYAGSNTAGTAAQSYGGGLYSTTATVSLDNSTISDCHVKSESTGTTLAYAYGGGIYTNYGITLSNSKIDGCDTDASSAGTLAESYGGGIYSSSTSVTVSLDNSTISDCHIKSESTGTTYAYAYGGGIYTKYGFTLDSGSKVQGCDADSTTLGTLAYSYGGGVYSTGAYTSALKNGSDIAGCSVTASGVSATQSYGGGIYIYGASYSSLATLNINDSEINNCNAGINGGGIYCQYTTATMDAATITGCSATDGGGVYNYYKATFYMKNGAKIASCIASGNGGGVNNTAYTSTNYTIAFDMDNATITGCSADNGGGVYNTERTTVTIANGIISSNNAGADGAGVYLNTTTSTLNMTSGSITNNKAANGDGGGIYTVEYNYYDPVTSGHYSNVTTASAVVFSGNTAQTEFEPPSDASASYLSNLGFSTTSQSSTTTTTHILNNYDVNYRRLTVNLTYNSNVNTYSSSMTDIAITETVNTGSTVTVKYVDDSTLNFTTRGVSVPPGYEFDCWSTTATGAGTSYYPNDAANNTFTITADTVLYARWKPIEPSITIEKYGDQDGTTQLADAQFTVERETSAGVWEYYMYDAGTSSWVTTVNKSDSIVTTTSSGGILANLPDGTYKFTEVAPPTSSNVDYSILRESFEVTVPLVTTTDYTVSPYNYTGSWQYDGANYYYYNLTYEVTDAATLYMPTAGSGFNQFIYIAIGLFVLAFTAVIFVITRKRKVLKLQVRHPKPEKTLP
ncbi:MAG: beta strand repeat-containing protein [Lachnospiraceae bacterium]